MFILQEHSKLELSECSTSYTKKHDKFRSIPVRSKTYWTYP